MLQIVWSDESLQLYPERAVYWPGQRSLIVADPHFGKAASFRSAGIPVPGGTTGANLDRLTSLILRTRAERLIILGDFFHARAGRSASVMERLEAWRQQHRSLAILLIRGNHDRSAGDPPCPLDIACVEEGYHEPPFLLCHEPLPETTAPTLAGHVHPAVVLRDVDGSTLRAPCFLFGPKLGILPAFGSFTGCKRLKPLRGDRVFVIGEGEVVEVSAPGSARTDAGQRARR